MKAGEVWKCSKDFPFAKIETGEKIKIEEIDGDVVSFIPFIVRRVGIIFVSRNHFLEHFKKVYNE